MIAALERYWADYGCVVMQPYHTEVGAGTFNPATFLRCLGPEPWSAAYVEPSSARRTAATARTRTASSTTSSTRSSSSPRPRTSSTSTSGRSRPLGIDLRAARRAPRRGRLGGPTLGAWGLGWEVWVDGMEVTQFTYFQQLGGLELDLVPAEITYGLERLAMFLQGKKSAFELEWAPGVTVGRRVPGERAAVVARTTSRTAPVDVLMRRFEEHEAECRPAGRAGAAAPGLRPGAQVLACVQPARRARRHLRHRARGLHRARAEARARAVAEQYVESLAGAAV